MHVAPSASARPSGDAPPHIWATTRRSHPFGGLPRRVLSLPLRVFARPRWLTKCCCRPGYRGFAGTRERHQGLVLTSEFKALRTSASRIPGGLPRRRHGLVQPDLGVNRAGVLVGGHRPVRARGAGRGEGVYDRVYDGQGNWPLNTAYAATAGLRGPNAGLGYEAEVARFESMADAERWVAAGVPVVISSTGTKETWPAPHPEKRRPPGRAGRLRRRRQPRRERPCRSRRRPGAAHLPAVGAGAPVGEEVGRHHLPRLPTGHAVPATSP